MRLPGVIIVLLITIPAFSQFRKVIERKMSPLMLQSAARSPQGEELFIIKATDPDSLRHWVKTFAGELVIISDYHPASIMILKMKRKLVDSIARLPFVSFIDMVRTPKEESIIDGFDLSTNKVNLVHNKFPDINGDGLTVSVKENRPDTNDIDFTGRFRSTTGLSPVMTSHATIMTTIVAGGGNTFLTGKGVAWAAGITSSDFTNLVPNSDQYYQQHSISVQNHSYGTGIENYYGADAEAYDASTISNPSLVHVFSAGNSGDKTGTTGPYAGRSSVANITGSFKMAKNIIVVGAVDSFGSVPLLSSRGPTYDGRLRPEIVAFAQDGSSGAAALVSGTAVVMQHAYKKSNAGQLPPSALVKSAILNSADDTGLPGIDFISGFGSLNAWKAVQTIQNKNFFSGQVKQNELKTHSLVVPPGVSRLKITICWNDPPAQANDARALVNDLDLRLLNRTSGESWQPWVLSTAPNVDSLTAAATRRRDSINNVEFISIDSPGAGLYSVEVKGYKIPNGIQAYHISYQLDSTNFFLWSYPTVTDLMLSGTRATLRWDHGYPDSTASLYYSLDAGKQWKLAASDIDLRKKHFNWVVPDTITNIVFRMIIAGKSFDSDTTQLSTRLMPNVGFNCSDSFSLHWRASPLVKSFTVFRLGKKYLEPFMTTPDTSIILLKSDNPSMQYAVAPNVASRPGIKSYAFNYSTQGVGCYIKSFLVDLLSTNTGAIQVELGTTYQVTELTLEKSSSAGFEAMENVVNANALRYDFTDRNLQKGSNTYRVRIDLENGEVVYSNPETIFYLPGLSFLVYPNPAKSVFNVFSRDTDKADIRIFNLTGQEVFKGKINSTLETIRVPHLKRGVYFISITESNESVYHGRLVLQ